MHLIISIALGIVLAVIILALLPDLLAIGIILALILIGIALLILFGVLFWNYPAVIIFVALFTLAILIPIGYEILKKKRDKELEYNRLQKIKSQERSKNEEKDAVEIKQRLHSFSSIPHKDTDHIPSEKFEGNPETLSHPVSVSRAAAISSMLEFEIIDLIKLGYLAGVRYRDEWFFDLKR